MTNPEATERITNFHDARAVGAYELARKWGANEWPVPVPRERAEAAGVPVREVVDDLEELAVMAALRSWLDGWMPISIHKALLAGATMEQLVLAMGTDGATIARAWREWDKGQRHLWETFPDMDHTAEHDRVAAILRSQVPDIQLQSTCTHPGAVDIVSLLGPADSNAGVPANDGREIGAAEGTCPECGARVVTVNIYDPREPWGDDGHGGTDRHTNWTPWREPGR